MSAPVTTLGLPIVGSPPAVAAPLAVSRSHDSGVSPVDLGPRPTSGSSAAAGVVAVLVAHDGENWLPRTLAALASSLVRPLVVVAVDTGSTDGTAARLAAEPWIDEVVTVARRTGYGRAVAAGAARARALVETLNEPPGSLWLWLVHDDSAVSPTALGYLLDTVLGSPTVAVAGCKQVDWSDPVRLLEVGCTVTPAGVRHTGLGPNELDQGQHDGRSDVLAVSTAGALIRLDAFDAVGGFDPALPLLGDDLDFCRRIRSAGHRVVVVPAAVVAHRRAMESAVRPADALGPAAVRRATARSGRSDPKRRPLYRYERRHAAYMRLVNAPVATVGLLLAWLGMAYAASGVAALVSRDVPRAVANPLAWWDVALRPWRVAGGIRRRIRAQSGDGGARGLAPSRLDLAWDGVERWAAERAARGQTPASVFVRVRALLIALALSTTLAWALVRVTALVTRGEGTGAPVAGDTLTALDLWRRAGGAVSAVGGASGSPDPAATLWSILAMVAALTHGEAPLGGTLTQAYTFWSWAHVPLALLAAWIVVREAAPTRWVALALAAQWAALPLAARAAGLPYATTPDLLLVHSLLPLAAWGFVVAARRDPPGRQPVAILVAAFAAAAVVALQPSTWPVLAAAGLSVVVGLIGRAAAGDVGRALAARGVLSTMVVVATPALIWPGWFADVRDAPAIGLAAPANRLAGAGGDDFAAVVAAGPVTTLLAQVLLAVVLGVAVLVAVAGRSVRTAMVLVCAAALALWCEVISRVDVTGPGGRVVGLDPPWVVALAALMGATALGAGALCRTVGGMRGRFRSTDVLVAAGFVAACLALPLAIPAAWASGGTVTDPGGRPGPPLPAALDAASPARTGVLTFTGTGAEGLGWALDRGPWGPGSTTTAGALSPAPAVAVDDAGPAAVEAAVADIAARLVGTSPPVTASDSNAVAVPDLAQGLAELAVGWVVVDGRTDAAAAARQAIGTRAALLPVSQSVDRSVWRVDFGSAPVAWARLSGPEGSTALDASTDGVDVVLPSGAARTVVLATEVATQWSASVNGSRAVVRQLDRARVGVDIGPDGGRLILTRAGSSTAPTPMTWALLGLAAIVVITALLAGTRHGRRSPTAVSMPVPRRITLVVASAAAGAVALVGYLLQAIPDSDNDVTPLAHVVELAVPTSASACPGDTAAVLPPGTAPGVGVVVTAATSGLLTGPDAQISVAGEGGTRGTLAVTACPLARTSGWAFAGGTGTGEQPRLVLSNLGEVPAGYTLELLTATGRATPAAGRTGTVAPGSSSAVAVDALLPDQGVLAVAVTASSGALAATMHDSATAGLATAGVDDEAFGGASEHLILPVVVATGAVGAGVGGVVDGATPGDPGVSYVALAVPGDAGGVARVRVGRAPDLVTDAQRERGAGDIPAPSVETTVVVAAGSVVTVPMPTAPGVYTVIIDADVPMIAAARTGWTSGGGVPADFGWAGGVEPQPLDGLSLRLPALPSGVEADTTLVVSTLSAAHLDVDLLDTAGAVVDSAALDSRGGGSLQIAVPRDRGADTVRLHTRGDNSTVGAVGLIVTAVSSAPTTPQGDTAGQPLGLGGATTTYLTSATAGPLVRLAPA